MSLHQKHNRDRYAKFIDDIQNSGSQLHKNFTFKEEQIVIHMTTVQNNEVVVSLQNENTVVPLQGTDTVHPKIDPADEVEHEKFPITSV